MGLFLHASDSGRTISNRILYGTAYTGPIIVSSASETLRNITYGPRLRLVCPPDGDSKWGKLTYNEVDCRHIGLIVEGIKHEHDVYNHSPRGLVYFQGGVLFNAPAQGYQEVGRAPECNDIPACKAGGISRFEQHTIAQCGNPIGYGRASFAMSFFGWQDGGGTTPRMQWNRPIELVDQSILHDSHGLYELRGALLAEFRPYLRVWGGSTEYRGVADRSLWLVHGTPIVDVDSHGFVGAKRLDIEGTSAVPLQSVSFKGCWGDVHVRLDPDGSGKWTDMGPVSQGVSWAA